MTLLRIVDFLIQPGQILLFPVVGLQILEIFEALLNPCFKGHIGLHRLPVKILLDSGGQQGDGKGHRQHPHRRKSHRQVHRQQANAYKGCGNHGPRQLRHIVRKCRLQGGAVPHNGVGQVRQVLLPEKGQGNQPQLFRQGDAAHPALHIGGQVGGVVLKARYQENHHQAGGTAKDIAERPIFPDSPVHQIQHKPVQKPYRKHERQILGRAGQAPFNQIHRPLAGQSKTSLQFLNHALASFAIFQSAALV